MVMKHGEEYITYRRYRANKFKTVDTNLKKPRKPPKTIDKENIDICLNCDNPNCKGYCDKLKRRKL